MGADTTSTHLIFFIAATVIATATAGILSGVVLDVSGKASIRGKAFGDELQSEVKIVNDPARVPNNPVIFYVKNTGSTTLDYGNMTVIVDGTLVTTTKALLNSETSFRYGAITEVTYTTTLATGDHYVQVSMENGVSDEMRFRE
ncbi:MAG: flagellar protein G [Candidatus Thermoplasmatota archaeon]